MTTETLTQKFVTCRAIKPKYNKKKYATGSEKTVQYKHNKILTFLWKKIYNTPTHGAVTSRPDIDWIKKTM
jgi:hypothetical protein